MKRETLRHPKTYDLASRLGCSRPEALGYLTLLWDWTAEVAMQGNIGKWPNGAIARACDWMGDADEFVSALVDAKWFDHNDDHRLVIHDWPQHCERWVKSKLSSAGLSFLPCYFAETTTVEDTSQDTSQDTSLDPPCDRTEPNRTEPNPSTSTSGATALSEDDLTEIFSTAKRYADSIPKTNGRRITNQSDADLLLKVALLRYRNVLAESTIERAFESVRSRSPPPDKPFAYLHKSLSKSVPGFNGLLKENPVPPALLEMAER